MKRPGEATDRSVDRAPDDNPVATPGPETAATATATATATAIKVSDSERRTVLTGFTRPGAAADEAGAVLLVTTPQFAGSEMAISGSE
jgi:hypothetical protein